MELAELDADLRPAGCHLLHIAAMRPSAKPLQDILESAHPHHVDVKDRHGRTPLLLALQHGRTECARLLILHGASVAGDPVISDLLSLPASLPLLESLAVESPGLLPLQSGHLLLPHAAAEGKIEVLRGVLGGRGAVDAVDRRDETGRTALHHACQNGRLACVELLLEHGADASADDSRLSTPLHLACRSDSLDMVRLVVGRCVAAANESVVLNKQDVLGCTPGHVALYSKCWDVAAFLLRNFHHRVDLTLRDRTGHSLPSLLFALRFSRGYIPSGLHSQLPCLSEREATWLLHCAISDKDVTLFQFAISQGANVHSFDLMQHSAFLLAAKTGFLEACKLLVAHGARVGVADQAGLGPLHHAARGRHVETFSYLLSLPGIDIGGFYASCREPPAADVLGALVLALKQSASMPRPQAWVKWLCLVMPSADHALFAAFAEHVCPSDWVDVLADPGRYPPDSADAPSTNVVTRASERCATISVCSSGEPYPQDHHLLFRRVPPGLLKRNVFPKRFDHSCGKTRQTCIQVKEVAPTLCRAVEQKQRQRVQPFCHPKEQHRYYPLHVAILSGNMAALCCVLSLATEHTLVKLVGLVDDCDRTVYELLLQLHPEICDEQLRMVPFPEHLWQKLHPLTWNDLMYYFISGSTSTLHTILKQEKKAHNGTYVQLWPHWCYVLKATEYCRTNGIPSVSFGVEADQIRIASHILANEKVDLNQLLHVAVEFRCLWAISLLVEKGASPVVPCRDGKFALCTAITGCNLGVVDALLKHGTLCYISPGDRDRFFPSLFSALLTMAHNGLWRKVLQFVSCIPDFNTLELMSACQNIFCASLQQKGGCEVATFLLQPFLSMFFYVLTNWLSLPDKNHSSFLFLLRRIQQSLRGTNSLVKDIGVLKSLIAFCNNRFSTMSTVLHQLCAAGNLEEVKMLIAKPDDAHVLYTSDSHNMSPLLLAVVSGHLDILTLCAERFGCSSLPPCLYLGGILHLALTPYYHLSARAPQDQTRWCHGGHKFARHVLKELNLLPRLFSPVVRDPAALPSFMEALALHCQDRTSLFCAQGGGPLIHLLLLISLIPDLTPLLSFLKDMQVCLSDTLDGESSAEFSRRLSAQADDAGLAQIPASLHPLQAALERATLSFLATFRECFQVSGGVVICNELLSILDFAVNFATLQTCKTGAEAFDDILAQFALFIPLTAVDVAASKGLWKVVEVAGQNLIKLHQFHKSYSLNKQYMSERYYDALCMALRRGKKKAADAIFGAFLYTMKSLKQCRHYWQLKLLCMAVRYDRVEHIQPIVSIEGYYEVDKRTLQDSVARYGSKEALQVLMQVAKTTNCHTDFIDATVHLASKYNRANLLEYLHYLTQSSVSEDDARPPQNLTFWCSVLLGAAEGGNERLALQAVASISERDLSQLRSHPKYLAVLHWCGLWGLADLLECIPFAADDIFLCNEGVWPSAWESAVANGHIGRLCSRVPNFPLMPKNLQTWMEKSCICIETIFYSRHQMFADSLLTGSFHTMMKNAASKSSCGPKEHNHLQHTMRMGQCFPFHKHMYNSICSSFFYYGCWYGVMPMVEACLETLGKLAGHVLHYLQQNKIEIIHRVCKLSGSFPLLQALLKALFDAELLNTANDLDHRGHSPLAMVSLRGDVESMKALLQSGPRSVVQFTHHESKDNLLHYAVMSKNPSAVRVICKALGKEASTLCLRNNKAGICPLHLAFAMGYYLEASELMSLATVRDKVMKNVKIQVIQTAKRAFGWFRLMMERNKSSADVALDTHTCFPLLNIRNCKTLQCVLACALKARHSSLALNILEASSGLVLNNDLFAEALLNPLVFTYMKTNDLLSSDMPLQFSWTKIICFAIASSRAVEAIQATNILLSKKVTLDFEKLFEAACCANDSCFVHFMLKSELVHNVPKEKLSRGFNVAAALTRLETGLILQSQLGIKIDNTDSAIPLTPLSNVIFSDDLGYFHIVNAFFQSTVQQSSLLPTLWLAHSWTDMECEHIDGHCKARTQCNPWQLTSRIQLHVEWNSFLQVMATHIDFHTSRVPLWVEALVFSHAVIGQFCTNLQQFPNLTAVTLACVLCPAMPTAVVSNDHVHIVVSYLPEGNFILFPACFTPEPMVTAKGLECPQLPTRTQYLLKDSIATFAQNIARSIAKTFCYALEVSVELDETLSIVDPNTFGSYFLVVQLILEDFHLALKLMRRPGVKYPYVFTDTKLPMFMSGHSSQLAAFLSHVIIRISVVSRKSELSVSFKQKTLEVEVFVGYDVHEWVRHWHEYLLRDLSMCLCKMEFEYRKGCLLKFFYDSFLPKLCKLTKCRLCIEMATLYVVETDQGSMVTVTEASVKCLTYLKQLNKIKYFLLTFSNVVKLISCKPHMLSIIRQLLSAGIHIVLSNYEHSRLLLQNGSFHYSINLSEMDCSVMDCLYNDVLQACLPSGQRIDNLGSRTIAPYASYIDWENSPGLLYPVLGCKKTITFHLVDYTKHVLSSIGGCTIEVRVAPLGGKQYSSALSSTDQILSTSNYIIFKPGLFSVEWTPQKCGHHSMAILVNKLHINGSPMKIFVSTSECDQQSMYHVGSGGVRQTTAGTPLVFMVSHPQGRCDWTSPSLSLPEHRRCSFQPKGLPSTMHKSNLGSEPPSPQSTKSRTTKPLGSTPISGSPRLAQLKMYASSEGPLHYLSVCSNIGKTKDWINHQCPTVQILTLGTSMRHQKLHSIPLGRGRYRISLRCCVSGAFKVLAVCSSCQAVMCIHWADQKEFLPLQCYVLPGPMSPAHSIVSKRKTFNTTCAPCRETCFGPYTAGVPFVLYVKARDIYCNPHSAGGSYFFRAFIKNGEKGDITPSMSLDDIRNASLRRTSERGDVNCAVLHEGAGVYSLTCQAFCAGLLDVIAMTVQGRRHVMASVAISSGSPHAPHCRLELGSTAAALNEPFACHLHTFDKWGNPCSKGAFAVKHVVATYNGQSVAVRRLIESEDNGHIVMVSFTPDTPGTGVLNITVHGEQVPLCPVELTVAPHTKAFSENLKQLLAHLHQNHSIGSTPTLTIKRSDVLGSAMEVMHAYVFHQVVRVRFEDEPGIDAGGIAKEFFHLLSLEMVNPNYNLFHSVNGLYKPSPSSGVNPNHLVYFTFFGKILAKAICEGHTLLVRFTPSVYKFLLGVSCSLDDVKLENLSLYLSLIEILHCENQEQLAELAMNFDVNVAHFGRVETVELEKGGSSKEVTIENREQFVFKMYQWYLKGCINQQLSSMKQGFDLLVPQHFVKCFSAYELEVIISGLRTIDVGMMQQKTKYTGYSKESPVIVWLWELLSAFSEEEKSRFLQFTTGCACLPCDDIGKWELHIKKCSYASAMLPTASTCFNTLSLPEYPSKDVLKQKLTLAITFGAGAFLYH